MNETVRLGCSETLRLYSMAKPCPSRTFANIDYFIVHLHRPLDPGHNAKAAS
jgi:hypothetical protein